MVKWLTCQIPTENVGSDLVLANWLIKTVPSWVTGAKNGASFHLAVNKYMYLAIDRDGNCTLITVAL